MLKKVNIEIPALEKTANVAEVVEIKKDKSGVVVNLWRTARRQKIEVGGIDETPDEVKYGPWEPVDLLAQNRFFNDKDAINLIGITEADYDLFYPPVVELTPEEIKAAEIARLRAVIDEATEKLNELEG